MGFDEPGSCVQADDGLKTRVGTRVSKRICFFNERAIPFCEGDPGSSMTVLSSPTTDATDQAIRIPSGVGCIAIVGRRHGLHIAAEQITARQSSLRRRTVGGRDRVLRFARRTKAKRVQMTWRGLSRLRKALPVVVTLTSGGSMVLECSREATRRLRYPA